MAAVSFKSEDQRSAWDAREWPGEAITLLLGPRAAGRRYVLDAERVAVAMFEDDEDAKLFVRIMAKKA